jgi:hypothetical protein
MSSVVLVVVILYKQMDVVGSDCMCLGYTARNSSLLHITTSNTAADSSDFQQEFPLVAAMDDMPHLPRRESRFALGNLIPETLGSSFSISKKGFKDHNISRFPSL